MKSADAENLNSHGDEKKKRETVKRPTPKVCIHVKHYLKARLEISKNVFLITDKVISVDRFNKKC